MIILAEPLPILASRADRRIVKKDAIPVPLDQALAQPAFPVLPWPDDLDIQDHSILVVEQVGYDRAERAPDIVRESFQFFRFGLPPNS